ncbi:response regulator receiver sensor signal transduction histidine kinase [Caldithrix abyssi DSM 13497]|uniref:histidine kinase n=1 Tax=Caldithrix abyssi DSM 13497 TaxID=880073 RepID=H1XXG7_CALAY|nr:response regulator [Caldithrix abyssi]APF17893.1 His Kinase A (phospho-acceptor) domain-containing protein [Caldithrix abyssi DSM 13497]EHO41952.1 response regulator receiver sensor signal transduction histidine kinase [Caldithrix abyssi DSM 13497]
MDTQPKVLIVDDDKENVDLIAYFLKPQNYKIITAHNGVDALKLVEKENPDLILLDIKLPKMDGFEVCERIKKKSPTKFIPIIMITALKDLKSKIRSLEAGADDFISKPFENIELLTRVKSLLRIKKYHDELEQKNKELEEKNQSLLRMDQFKEELNHLIIHDMKNPIFVIQGNLQMLMMGLDDSMSNLKKYVDRIDRSTQNLLRMVMNLIDITKIETGSMSLKLELASLNDVVENSLARIKDFPEAADKQINVDFVEQMPYIKLDVSVMERVVDNLLSFALANVPTDGRVDVKTFKTEHTVGASIHDYGQQIPLKYGNNVFNKFRQIEIKKEGYRVGRGLGLTFCNLAVEAHGGKMYLDEKNEIGNKIIFEIPINN